MSSTPHAQLLDRVVEHLVRGGGPDTSLRALAAAIGTSHRMLIYHFGSHDALIAEVVDEVEQRQRTALSTIAAGEGDLAAVARRFWRQNSSAEIAPLTRLLFGLYARLLESGDTDRAAALVTAWLDPTVDFRVRHGTPRPRARAVARLSLAVTRGLLLDLLATGDRRAVNAAMNCYVDALLTGRSPDRVR